MKQKLYSYFSCIMAIVVLLSTTSWTVEKHYCMGNLVDVSFFVDAEDCGLNMSSEFSSANSLKKKSCCADEVITIEGQNNLTPSFGDFDLEQHLYLVAFASFYFDSLKTLDTKNTSYKYYSPPKIVKDIQVLDAVFLI